MTGRSPLRALAALGLLLACLPGAPVAAETLQEAWAAALENDLRLQATRSRTRAAEAQLAAAKSNRNPALGIEGAFTQLDHSPALDPDVLGLSFPLALPGTFSNDNFVAASAQVSVPLYTSGLIGYGIQAADAAVEAHEAQEHALVQDLKLEVAESFVAVLRAQSAVAVANASVISLEAHLEDVRNLFRKDLVPRNDVLSVTVSLADARQSALRASNALDIAYTAYNRLLSRPMDSRVILEEVMPPVAPEAGGGDVGALTETALAARTELEVLMENETALRRQAEAVRAQLKPQLAASAGYGYLENDVLQHEGFAFATVGLSWALFDGGRTDNRAQALLREAQAISEQRADLATRIQLQVRSAFLEVNETRQRLAVTEAAIAQADENLRIARSRYNNGLGTNTEVLDAETLRALTDSNHNNARYDAALATLRLARAIGVL